MGEPEKRFKVGGCTASIFANDIPGGTGVRRSVSLQRTYMDQDGQFKATSSFGLNDIPKAVMALLKAYDYLATTREQAARKE